MTMTEPAVAARVDAETDQAAVTTLRLLAADMVHAANSGHPGMPLGAAPMMWALWSRHLRHDPTAPQWPDRDRFVLSAGHGSALLYATLHLAGYDVSLDDLRGFRQLGSATPGHPEFGHTPGVETTTGPLGQGIANAVGLALAERLLAARESGRYDHHTYAIVGDGCLMEGISQESASLAGHLGLGRLIVLWDDNDITIDGHASASTSEDQLARFAALGWHVSRVEDGDDLAVIDAVDLAIAEAKADPRPSLIAVRTRIGRTSPAEDTTAAHGTPLTADALAAMREAVGWPAPFHVPDEVRAACRRTAETGRAARADWEATHSSDPVAVAIDLAPLDEIELGDRATRQTSQQVLTALAATTDRLVGGSADLAGSTGTAMPGPLVSAGAYAGAGIGFGIREHAMAAVLNGIALHGGLRCFGSTFLVFSDYLRPALRLSALMGLPVVYVLTHDSVAVGEDGPTHQPVEHVESLRLIPGLQVLRPADAAETVEAWRRALSRTDGPTALVLSRQTVPVLDHTDFADPAADLELVATGSEVAVAIKVAQRLRAAGHAVRVVSAMDRDDYHPDRAARTVSIEAGVTTGWRGLVDLAVGIDRFGASGPGAEVLAQVGLDADGVMRSVLARWPDLAIPAPDDTPDDADDTTRKEG